MGHLHPPLQPDGHLRSGDSCWMKTGMGLGLLKGSANQPAIITDNNWASLPPPAAFDCSLSPMPFVSHRSDHQAVQQMRL